jgi:hypothetical protein
VSIYLGKLFAKKFEFILFRAFKLLLGVLLTRSAVEFLQQSCPTFPMIVEMKIRAGDLPLAFIDRCGIVDQTF